MNAFIKKLRELAEKATKGKRYAVLNESSYCDDDDDNAWTISLDPKEDGWNTDGGYPGYGLIKNDAVFFAACDPATILKLLDIIEIQQSALEYIISKEGHAEKPKWGNEFVDVAKIAISKVEAILRGINESIFK